MKVASWAKTHNRQLINYPMKQGFLPMLFILFVLTTTRLSAQTIYEYDRDDIKVLFFNKNLSQDIPHMIKMFENGKSLHTGIWNIDTLGRASIEPPMMMVTDWGDDGNGGVSAIPKDLISIGMAPLNFSYFIAPSNERYNHLFKHEYTHIVMSDKTSKQDRNWRKFTGGKFVVEPEHPFSAVWSFLSAPRWYTPRWYHEGIACFMETWLGGGVGRALGGYDEMYFRSVVDSGEELYSVVGLEAEGTTSDFQGGANSYLYGTRFVNYLEYKYGFDKLRSFYNRTDDSKTLFNRQFEQVYGNSLRNEWDAWRTFEEKHQKEQLATIEQYPVTPTVPLYDEALGSMAPPVLDEENNCIYTAVNHPGDFANIVRIDLGTHKLTKLHVVDNPQSYQTCYLALDKKNQRLFWTTQNGKYRGLRIYDIRKKRIVKSLNFQRVSGIVFDNAGGRLYGLFTNEGKEYLCRYDETFENREILYSFPFGLSVFDLDISHDGKTLTATTSGANGEQSLICFDIRDLEKANFTYKTLYTFEDSNLGQFRFAPGDSTMIGSSYYTGVSNIWSLDLKTKELSLLSNTRMGLFSPVAYKKDTIIALEFERNGMRPVLFEGKVLEDANAVTMLGQMAWEAHPEELEKLSEYTIEPKNVSFGEVYDSIRVYSSFKNFKFTGAYPEISGFTDKQAWNNVTPVLGYRFLFQDPLGINSLKMSIGISPWSNNDPKNQYHAQLQWKFWQWTLNAAWNPTSFYDLVGPIRSSRKGWQVGLRFDSTYSMLAPASHKYGGSINAYGMMDALPLFQEIETTISSFQTAALYYQYSKTRGSFGAVIKESGIETGVDAYTYLAGGKFFPTVNANFDFGFLIPVMRNTCMWIRSAVGQNFGDSGSEFGNEYFGGFGNNWLDYREANRYRSVNTFPGASIDQIKANSYAKILAELNLRPIRYNNFGAINIYPTYTQFSIFGTGLFADPWGGSQLGFRPYANVGIQINTEIVLFKFMKTTWSFGYAHAFGPDGWHNGDWLISLKLL